MLPFGDDGFEFALVPSDGYLQSQIDDTINLLLNNGVPETSISLLSADSAVPEGANARKLYVITTTIGFPQYNQVNGRQQFTMVTPDWVQECVNIGRLCPVEPFSPDPRHILKDVCLTVSGLSRGDKEAIYGGAWALGASFSDDLNMFTTHVIAMSDSTPECIKASSVGKIKITLPHWIDDCLKVRRRLDDTDYSFPDPPILRNPPNERAANPGEFPPGLGDPVPPPSLPREPIFAGRTFYLANDIGPLFSGKTFYLNDDLQLQHMRQRVRNLIEDLGGQITDDISKEANVYIGQFRDGPEFLSAGRRRITIGNLSWLYWMISQGQWTSPLDQLLHYPLVPAPIPGMENAVISVTNYVGEARRYLQALVNALGARYQGSMEYKVTTHLICAQPVGLKYRSARKWNIHVVNHLWLEESYALLDTQSVSHPRYSFLPNNSNLTKVLAATRLRQDVLDREYGFNDPEGASPTAAVHDSIMPPSSPLIKNKMVNSNGPAAQEQGNASPPSPPKNNNLDRGQTNDQDHELEKDHFKELQMDDSEDHQNDEPEKSHERPAAGSTPLPTDEQLAGSNQLTTAEESEQPSTPKASVPTPDLHSRSRSAKSKASDTLRGLSEAEYKYNKQYNRAKKTHALVPLDDESQPDPKRRRASPHPETTPKQTSKRAVSSTPSPATKMNVIITGLEGDVRDKVESRQWRSKLTKLNINIVSEPSMAAFIVSDRLARSEKFLSAIGTAKSVLCSQYLVDCISQNERIDPSESKYQLANRDPEVKALLDARPANYKDNKLFNGLSFNILSDVPSYDMLDRIVKKHGASGMHRITANRPKSFSRSPNKRAILIASKDYSKPERIEAFRKLVEDQGCEALVFDSSWIPDSIVSMHVDWEASQL